MRRVLLVLVLAVFGAGWYGLAGSTVAVAVNGSSVSDSALAGELQALANHPGLFCYYSSLAAAALSEPAAGNLKDTVSASGTAAWVNLRIEGLAVDNYVKKTFHYAATSAELAAATSALEGELSQAATQESQNCPGTSTQALAEMPAEMRSAQIEDQASSMYLVSKINKTIALTPANIAAYYHSHRADYDTICVAVAIVDPNNISAFAASQKAGLSVAALAKKYSVDPTTAAKGGADGCFGPTSTSFASVRTDVGTTPVGHFPTSPIPYTPTSGGTTYGLFVGATSKTPSSFAQAQAAVINDIQKSNATAANQVKANILYIAAVDVDPLYGRWGLSSSGPEVFAPALPATTGPATSSQLTTVATTLYQ